MKFRNTIYSTCSTEVAYRSFKDIRSVKKFCESHKDIGFVRGREDSYGRRYFSFAWWNGQQWMTETHIHSGKPITDLVQHLSSTEHR